MLRVPLLADKKSQPPDDHRRHRRCSIPQTHRKKVPRQSSTKNTSSKISPGGAGKDEIIGAVSGEDITSSMMGGGATLPTYASIARPALFIPESFVCKESFRAV